MRCHIIKQLVVVHIPRHSVPFPEYDLSTVSSVLNAIRGGNGETKNHLLTLVCALVRANLIASTPRSLTVLCRRGEAGENDEGKSGARCL